MRLMQQDYLEMKTEGMALPYLAEGTARSRWRTLRLCCGVPVTVLCRVATTKRTETAMAKGQMKSNREVKKPKKTEAEKLKAKTPIPNLQSQIAGDKTKK